MSIHNVCPICDENTQYFCTLSNQSSFLHEYITSKHSSFLFNFLKQKKIIFNQKLKNEPVSRGTVTVVVGNIK